MEEELSSFPGKFIRGIVNCYQAGTIFDSCIPL